MNYQTFTCTKCNSQQSYNPNTNYLFKCATCGRDYQVQNSQLITRADLYIDDGKNWRTNEKTPPNAYENGQSPAYLIIIYAVIVIGVILGFVGYFSGHKEYETASKSDSTANKLTIGFASSSANSTSTSNIGENQSQSISNSLSTDSFASTNVTKPSTHLTYIPDIVSINKITTDESYNHLLEITINNPYDKPISDIQVYISDDGNLSIPEGISEDNFYLRSMNIDPLKPNTKGIYTISTNDKGAEGKTYVVLARRIRFTDGTTAEP